MIMYRNPLDQWFWETGWQYIGSIALVLLVWFLVWQWWDVRQSKAARKKRWLEMSETQRRAWRHFNQRNNFEAEEWEK